ncbi:MAG: hypothetical protein KA354_08380 [Phycisphaerae bacterium]|nr:hypothetical protein [Phycisphaerae bacterium]
MDSVQGHDGAAGHAGWIVRREDSSPAIQVVDGVCYVLFALDIGLAIDLNEAERRVTDVKQRETIRHKRRTPQYFEYDPPPLRVTQDILPLVLGDFQTAPVVDMMIYDFGAVSVTYTIPLAGSIFGLLALSDVLYDNNALLADARSRVEHLLATIAPAVNKPRISDLVEDYAIYRIEALTPGVNPDRVLADHGSLLAQILRAELSPLSAQEVNEALSCRIAFSDDDLAIMDWNAAVVLGADTEDVRAVLEYANVELLEMRFLDDRLDDALDQSYEALTRQTWRRRLLLTTLEADMRRVAELQVDSALLFEGVNNALKLLGDQYLARVYRAASQRLHLGDWDASIIRKLQTLESIYQKMTDENTHRRMEVLEWIIIILIAMEIVMSFFPGLTGS